MFGLVGLGWVSTYEDGCLRDVKEKNNINDRGVKTLQRKLMIKKGIIMLIALTRKKERQGERKKCLLYGS